MELQKVLQNRMSVRQYNEVMPTDNEIQDILNAGLLGPIVRLHKLHFSVITNKELMNEAEDIADTMFAGLMKKPYMYGAPVWIILSGAKYNENSNIPFKIENAIQRMNENLFWTVGSIIENMELKAVELGLASCGINTTVVSMANHPEFRAKLGIPEGYDALASLVVGHTDLNLNERQVNPALIPVNYVK